jgi:hypothetical protein
MHRANIVSAEALIDEVRLRLHVPHPVSARGMARLRQLLSDGTGPLYRHGSGDLAGRLGAVLAALRPQSITATSLSCRPTPRAVTPPGIQDFLRPGTGFGSQFP